MQLKKMAEIIRELKEKRDTCRCYDYSGELSPEAVDKGKYHFEQWWDSWILPKVQELEQEVVSELHRKTPKKKIEQHKMGAALLHALTEYDRKQSVKPGYNRYALAHYCGRIQDIMRDIRAGADPRKAIIAGFTGRVQSICLRAIGQPIATVEEQDMHWCYTPVAAKH